MNEVRSEGLGDRLVALSPLFLAYLVLAALYVWQASNHPTPWLFSDEIEYAQISRAISETGTPARRGVEYWGAGLFPWVIAPFWWIDSLESAYGAVKTFNVLVMTAAIFPTYGLARLLMSRPFALLAGAGAVVAPSFIYSAMVMQEPVAYLTAATAFYVTALALTKPTRITIAGAVVVGLAAPFVRDQLIVIPAMMIASLALRSVCFGAGRAYLGRASRGARAALIVVVMVGIALAVVIAPKGSGEAELAFQSPGVMLDQALWAWGALLVGLGVLPVVIALAMMIPARPVGNRRALGAFVSVLGASVALFTAYVAVKGAYQAAVFEPRVAERNLLYLTPIIFVGLALFTATRAVRIWALLASAAATAWAISAIPIDIGKGLAGDAPGLAILSRLNSDHELTLAGAHRLLYGLLGLSVVVGLAPRVLPHRQRVGSWIVVGAALLSIGWSLKAEIAASDYSNEFSQLFYKGLPSPPGWVDEATAGAPTAYLGQKIANPNGIWSLEFWNRSVRRVWSLDGTAPGPGPTLTPSLLATDGRLSGNPGYRYVIVDNGIVIAGKTIATQGGARLVRIEQPLRLTESTSGVFSDAGWIGSTKPADSVIAGYNRFDAPAKPGTVYVTLSREAFCGPKAPGDVLIEVGTLGLGQQRDGVIDRVTERRGWVVDSCAHRTFAIPTPGGPFHVRVTITPPFQPAALDPKNFERRYFGAQLGVKFEPPS